MWSRAASSTTPVSLRTSRSSSVGSRSAIGAGKRASGLNSGPSLSRAHENGSGGFHAPVPNRATVQPARKLSLALLAVVLAFSAQAAVADAGTTTLNPGQEAQVAAFALKGRDVVQYTYSTGLDTVFPVKASGTEVFNATGQAVHGSFTAPSDGTYAVSFYNGGSYMTG